MTFYTAGGTFSATLGEDPATDLLAVTWQKSLATASQPGQWSTTFTLRQGSDGETWASRLSAQDGCVIEMRTDVRTPWTTVVVGWVNSVAVATAPSGMSSSATVTVSGGDMCKPLTKGRADFYDALKVVNTQRQYAVATTSAQGSVAPVAGSTVVGTLSAGQQAPVVLTTSGWVEVTLPEGAAWIPSAQVQIVQRADPYAATLEQIMQTYSLQVHIGGSSVGGLGGLILDAAAKQFASRTFTGSANPPTLIAMALLAWVFRTFNVPWHLGRQVLGLPDLLRFALERPAYGIGPTSAALSPLQGNVWSFFASIQDSPLFELFLDTRSSAEIDGGHLVDLTNLEQTSDMYDATDGATIPNGVLWGEDKAKAVLVYRQTPFNQQKWQSLLLHHLEPIEVGPRQVSKGDSDVVNLFFPYPDIGSLTNSPVAHLQIGLLDAGSGVRYGLSSLRVPIRGLPSESQSALEFYGQMANDMWHWFRDNPEYYAGTIRLQRLRPEIRVGQRVLDEATGLSYYVEGVSHSFQVRTQGTTTLQVSRGAYRPSPTDGTREVVG